MFMKRCELDFVLKQNSYLEGGTKEACVKAKEFLSNVTVKENVIRGAKFSAVSPEEFLDALDVLIAAAFEKEDTIPELYKCNGDCKKISNLICPGQYNLNEKSDKKCPFFMDEADV